MFINLTHPITKDTYSINPETIFLLSLAEGVTEILQVLAPNAGCVKALETPKEILALIEAEKAKALRDEMAGRVAIGIMRICDEIHGTAVNRDDIAMESYRMADAMLKAREVK
jgi:hypothetical protein